LLYDCEVVVFAIVVQFEPPSVENSHLRTFPVLPTKVSVPLLFPGQTAALPLTVPPTEVGLTIREHLFEMALLQGPANARSVITTLYREAEVAASLAVTFEMVSVAVLEPEILPPSVKFVVPFLHWYVKFEPVELTVNVAVFPVQTVCEAVGCEVIAISWSMLSIALFEVTDVHGDKPLTITVYVPASETSVGSIVNVDVFEPLIKALSDKGAPSLYH